MTQVEGDASMIEVLKQTLEALENMHLVEMTIEDLQSWNKANKFLRRAIAELESQEPVAHCEAGPEFCQQCYKESLPTYGSEEVSKLREVIQSQAKIIADYEKQIDEPAIYPEEAYEMGLEAIAYYTHPPQRTWVGLTEQEVWDAVRDTVGIMPSKAFRVYQAIEAELKEKNCL
jgi:hypothetical protein